MSNPSWRNYIKDQVAVNSAQAEERGSNSRKYRISRVAFSVAAHVYLVRAARKRGLSLSSYIRRATMAFAAADLGEPKEKLFAADALLTEIDNRGTRVQDLDGKMFGTWEVRDVEP